MDRKTIRGNRLGLLIMGLLLTLLGGYTLARGAHAWPQNVAPGGEPLINDPVRAAFARYSPWLWWVIAAGAVVLALFGLRWLLVQGRRERLGDFRLESGSDGVTDVRADTVADAMADEVGAHPAVLSASASMIGTRAHPAVRLRVVTDENAPMSALREQLGDHAIPHMRQALEMETVPAVAQVSLEEPPRPRRTVV
ncbi:alkaline shock response membrane anchor protein AmaP [Streptosporangium sp. NPDC004631]